MKILVVDDDEIIVEAICLLIKRSNRNLSIAGTAYNAKDALLIAEREAPDMILTDIYMPEMSGIDLMREIGKRGIRTKFIVLSAYRDFEYAQQSLKYGASEYILKPVSEQTLADTLDRVMKMIIDESKEKDLKRELVKDRLYYAITQDKMHEKNERDLNSLLPADEGDASYRVAIFEFNEIDGELNLYDKDNVAEVVDRIRNHFCRAAPKVIFDIDPYHLVVLMNMQENRHGDGAEKTLVHQALNAKNKISAELGLSVNIGISHPADSRPNLPSAYKKAVFAVRNKSFLSQEQQEGGSAIISRAIKFCKNNLSSDLTLDILAEHVRMNKSYFSYLFKKETGENFWRYVTNLKLEKAKELLMETNLKSYEIAAMVGYRNASHFGKVFKEYIGLTPSEFKEKNRH